MQPNFANRLSAAVQQKKNPVVVGLDPRLEQLPASLRRAGDTHDQSIAAEAYFEFCRDVIDAVAALVPAVKPQSAFFEELGPAGLGALARVVSHARQRDLLVIIDAKRNDIGSTAEAYARAYLGADASRPLAGDALTVSPYLGADSLEPFVNVARQRAAGLFILVKTSNPGGGQFQDLMFEGQPLFWHVAAYVEQLASAQLGTCGYGSIGAVVGATYRQQLVDLRSAMPHAWLLVPGYGSQGGTADDVAAAFDDNGLGAVINNSRGIIFAHARAPYAERFGAEHWQSAVEAATREMIDQLRDRTSVGRLG